MTHFIDLYWQHAKCFVIRNKFRVRPCPKLVFNMDGHPVHPEHENRKSLVFSCEPENFWAVPGGYTGYPVPGEPEKSGAHLLYFKGGF